MVRNDKVFTCGFSDPYYQARRDRTVLVGLACEAPPSPNCFCLSVGGAPDGEDGLDILMTALDGRYHVKALTPKGAELLESTAAPVRQGHAPPTPAKWRAPMPPRARFRSVPSPPWRRWRMA